MHRESATTCECLDWAHASRAQRKFYPYVRAACFICLAHLRFTVLPVQSKQEL